MPEIPPVDLGYLTTLFTRLVFHQIRYKFGGKAGLSWDSSDPRLKRGIDCSGFTRYALAKATGGKLVVPDGSMNQKRWCQDAWLHELARYSDVKHAEADNRLFICFLSPRLGGVIPGHVWFVLRGRTLESYGRRGIGSRPWDTKALLKRCNAAYELPVV